MDAAFQDLLAQLISEQRDRCLWFLAPDFQATSPESALRALSYIERYGDKAAFQHARELRGWLQQASSKTSAD